MGEFRQVFHKIGNDFLDGLDNWMSRIGRISLNNQLSEAKIYAQCYVNKSIIARLNLLGIYCINSKIA